MKSKLKLGMALFFVGLLGIFTLLTVSIPLDHIPQDVLDGMSPGMMKALILVNPAVLLLIAVIAGSMLSDRVGLKVPAIASALGIEKPGIKFSEQIKYGALLGLLAGVLIIMIRLAFGQLIPETFTHLESNLQITLLARFGYGGLTEEIIFRYGFMSFVVWVIFKITGKLQNSTYWSGIVIAGLLFGVGHFPAALAAADHPDVIFLAYILTGNTTGAVFFGWLYWKKGLESAFAGHIFAHVAMMAGEWMFQV
jgi:hypothetical protein